MPNISFFLIFMIFGTVSAWAKKATEDGKITLTEAAELAEELGELLGIPTEVQIPAPESSRFDILPGEETESAAPQPDEEELKTEKPPHKEIVL